MKIRYSPAAFVYLLYIVCFFCFFIGVFFIRIDILNIGTAREQDALLGGALSCTLSGVLFWLSYKNSIFVEVYDKKLLVENRFMFIRKTNNIKYFEIKELTCNLVTGVIKIELQNKNIIYIQPSIIREEGEITDNKDHPDIPGGGRVREMFNLKMEIQRRMSSRLV